MEMEEKKVSIIINNYNKAPYLRQCLQSVFDQTYKNWEIILWDDMSTDNWKPIAREFKNKIYDMYDTSIGYGKFRIYETFGELGYYTALDVPLGVVRWCAIQKATGDYIAILDADDWWHPEKLEKQMKMFNFPKVKLVYSDCFYVDTEVEAVQVGDYPIYIDEFKDNQRAYTFHDRYIPTDVDVFERLLTRYNFMPCLTLIFEREAFMKVIGTSTHYTSGEDYDWLLKMTANYEVEYIGEPLAYYRVNVSGSVNKQISSSLRATWYEIDIVKKAKKYKKLSFEYAVKFYWHLFVLYLKLIYKQIKEIKEV